MAAADARALFGGCRDSTAIDGDITAACHVSTTDGRVVICACDSRAVGRAREERAPAVPGALRPDRQAVALGHGDALGGCQRTAVAEDQVHVAGDLDAGVKGRVLCHRVPAPEGIVVAHGFGGLQANLRAVRGLRAVGINVGDLHRAAGVADLQRVGALEVVLGFILLRLAVAAGEVVRRLGDPQAVRLRVQARPDLGVHVAHAGVRAPVRPGEDGRLARLVYAGPDAGRVVEGERAKAAPHARTDGRDEAPVLQITAVARGGRHSGRAADHDLAHRALKAAADAGTGLAAAGHAGAAAEDIAAGDLDPVDRAARELIAARADARAALAARGLHGAAADGDGIDAAGDAAADARGILALGSAEQALLRPRVNHRRLAAYGNGIQAAGDTRADGRAVLAAVGVDRAAEDAHAPAASAVAGADARAAIAAEHVDLAARDRDRAGVPDHAVAADARGIVVIGRLCAVGCARVERAGAAALAVDGQAVAVGDGDALLGRQRRAVAEDQVHIARNRHAAVNLHVIRHCVPSGLACGSPDGLVSEHCAGLRSRGRAVCVDVGNALLLVVRHGDLVGLFVDGDLHPLGAGEGPLRRHEPFAALAGGVEQRVIADHNRLGRAGQPQRGQYLVKGHAPAALQHIFKGIISELDSVQREAVCGSRDGLALGAGVQRCGGHAARVPGDVVDVRLQVLVRGLLEREADLDGITIGGLELVPLRVHHLDVKGVADGHVLVLVAYLVDGSVRLALLIHWNTLHRQNRTVREYPGLRPDRHHHAADGFGLVEGDSGLGFRLIRLQHHGDGQRLIRDRERHIFSGHITLRFGAVGVFAGEQQEGVVLFCGDGFGGRDFFGGSGIYRHHSGIRNRVKEYRHRLYFFDGLLIGGLLIGGLLIGGLLIGGLLLVGKPFLFGRLTFVGGLAFELFLICGPLIMTLLLFIRRLLFIHWLLLFHRQLFIRRLLLFHRLLLIHRLLFFHRLLFGLLLVADLLRIDRLLLFVCGLVLIGGLMLFGRLLLIGRLFSVGGLWLIHRLLFGLLLIRTLFLACGLIFIRRFFFGLLLITGLFFVCGLLLIHRLLFGLLGLSLVTDLFLVGGLLLIHWLLFVGRLLLIHWLLLFSRLFFVRWLLFFHGLVVGLLLFRRLLLGLLLVCALLLIHRLLLGLSLFCGLLLIR